MITDPALFDNEQPYGELYIDADGGAHLILHTQGEDFEQTEISIRKFITLFQSQIDGRGKCPFNPVPDLPDSPMENES